MSPNNLLNLCPLLSLLLCALLRVCPASAQPSVHPDTLVALDEPRKLPGQTDSAIVNLSRLVESSPQNPDLLIRLGYAYLKNQDFDAAEDIFRKARMLDDTRPEPYVGLGLVYAEAPARGLKAYYNFRRASGEARRAVRIDSTYGPAYRLLGELHERFEEDHAKAIEYYTRYVELSPDNPDGLYYFGLACVRAHDYEKIDRYVRPYLMAHPEETRLIPFVAQAYFDSERYDLALEFFERHIQNQTEPERALYTDITAVASPKELQTYHATSGDERLHFLEQFWARRDPDILTRINERIIEHYRRVWYARTYFAEHVHPWDRRGEVYIRYGEPDYRTRSIHRQVNLDPQVEALRTRMAVEMYGHEAAYLTFTGPVFPIRTRNEAFADISGDLLAESNEDPLGLNEANEDPFQDDGTIPDEDLILLPAEEGNTRPDVSRFNESMNLNLQLNFEGYAPVTMHNMGALVPWETWIYTQVRGGIEIVFTDEMGNGRFDFAPMPPIPEGKRQIRYASRIQAHAPEMVYRKAASATPDYYRPGPRGLPLNFYYDLASFRGDETSTILEVYYGIPTDQVGIGRHADSAFVHVKCFLALADEGHTHIYRDAREIIYRSDPGLNQNRGAFVPEIITLNVPPGAYELQVQLKDQVSGKTGLYKQAVEVKNYRLPELAVSDLQLASTISDSARDEKFRKGDIWVLPMPTRAYRQAQKVYAYYEIYNLKKDDFGQTRYKAQYLIRSSAQSGKGFLETAARGLKSLFKSRKPQVSVTYEQTGKIGTEQEYFEIDLSNVSPGINILQVVVTDEIGGQSATREIRFRYGNQ